ncbi:MAG: phage Gp37/Gp68 family protein [Pseudomonadota bacterium]
MSENTAISWTDATFNPWWGCTKVSPACDHCYAERDAKRYQPGKVLWGVGSERRTFGEKHWYEPLRWARTLPAKLGRRPRVFCASMADVFDKDAPEGERASLWTLIAATPELNWLLLTKRIGNAKSMLPADWGDGYPNVWLGATVVSQEEADRDIPKLLATPARVRFLSIEPMLGDIRLGSWLQRSPSAAFAAGLVTNEMPAWTRIGSTAIDWVIAGGESGAHARPMHPDWVRSLRDECAAAGVAFHFKQWGEWAEHDGHKPTRVFSMDSDIGETLAGRCDGFITKAGEFVRDMDDATSDEPYRGMVRVGKKAAGRLLDGVEHNGFPGSL